MASFEAQWVSVLLTKEIAVAQCRLHFAVGASNDVSSNQAVAHTLASICTCTHCSVNSAGFTADQNGHIATAASIAGTRPRVSIMPRAIPMVSLAIAYRKKVWNVRSGHCSAKTLAVKRFQSRSRSLSILNLISFAYQPVPDCSELLWEVLFALPHSSLPEAL